MVNKCKFLLICIFAIYLQFCFGCNLLEGAVSNIDGWDVSACLSGLDTCWELFWDNSDKFEDGFVDAMNGLIRK